MFEYVWYVLNNPEDVEFWDYIPIILGLFVIVGVVITIKWIIKSFKRKQ